MRSTFKPTCVLHTRSPLLTVQDRLHSSSLFFALPINQTRGIVAQERGMTWRSEETNIAFGVEYRSSKVLHIKTGNEMPASSKSKAHAV
jgi:hypothetical protein